MSTARERILAAVRDGVLRATLPDAPPDRPDVSWVGRREADMPLDERVARFTRALTALTGHVHEVDSIDAVARVIDGIARAHGARNLISWDDGELGCDGLLGRLGAMGLSRVWFDLSPSADARQRDLLALDPVPIGLSGALAGLADTGAVVVSSGAGRSRLASLLPPVHVAILRRRLVYPSLAAFLRAAPDVVAGSANLVAIAGPSRTADIEMTLSHGVHGPKDVHVVLLA